MLRSLAERLGGILPSTTVKSKRRDGASAEYSSVPTQEKNEPQPPPDPTRPLSATEAAFVYLRMSLVTVAVVHGAVDGALIGKALEILRQKHSYLALALVPDFFAPGHLRFVLDPEAPLDYRIVPVEDCSNSWQALAEEEVTTQWEWNPKRLAWRLTMLLKPGKEAVLLWTHSPCIADAVSGTIFIHELLSLHASMHKALIPEKFELPPLPSVMSVVGSDSTLSEEVVLRAAYPVTKYQFSHPILRLHPAGPAPPPAAASASSSSSSSSSSSNGAPPRRSSFLFASVTADKMKTLHKICKSAHISVGSFLSTALVFANFRQLWRHGHASTVKPTKAELVFHVNMRPRLLTPRETQDIAYFISAVPAEWNFSPAITFWEAAVQVHAGIRTQLDRAPLFVVMLDWLLSFPERNVLQTLTSGRTGEIAISNLGAYPWSTEYDELCLDELYSAHSTAAFGAVHTLCTATAEKGTFSWVFDENVARREDAAEMLADVIRLVEHPPDKLFGMLDWLASCVREKEGLPPLTLNVGNFASDKALQPQEEAPQASSSYSLLVGSEAPVADPSLLHMEEPDDDVQQLAATPPPPVPLSSTPPPAAAELGVLEEIPVTPSPEQSSINNASLPPPLSPRGESLEAIEL